jgi:hypothetical protein
MKKANDTNSTAAAVKAETRRLDHIPKAPRAGLRTRTALIVHQRGITKRQLKKFYCLRGNRFDYVAFAR